MGIEVLIPLHPEDLIESTLSGSNTVDQVAPDPPATVFARSKSLRSQGVSPVCLEIFAHCCQPDPTRFIMYEDSNTSQRSQQTMERVGI